MTDDELRAIKGRWSAGSPEYQADVDALIAEVRDVLRAATPARANDLTASSLTRIAC